MSQSYRQRKKKLKKMKKENPEGFREVMRSYWQSRGYLKLDR